MIFLKTLISINDSNHRIEKSLSKLVREPFLTAIEQFKVSCGLEGKSKEEKAYREARFRNSLTSFDKALSLAEPNEKSFINLMRGFCALNLPGGVKEAEIHFRIFQDECEEYANELRDIAENLINEAEKCELKASKINVDELPKGLGGGTFFSMSVGEPKMRKASLLAEAKEKKEKADTLIKESNSLLTTANNLKAIIANS